MTPRATNPVMALDYSTTPTATIPLANLLEFFHETQRMGNKNDFVAFFFLGIRIHLSTANLSSRLWLLGIPNQLSIVF